MSNIRMKIPKFEIISGTYEEFLLGYHFVSKETDLIQSFAIHEHSSSIRCVATAGQYLATGAADDRVIVYDLNLRKEHCMLTHHNSTVNCLEFTSNHSHLISGSSDGELSIVRTGSWQLEKTWSQAHKGSAILDLAIHPSGKLALSLGSDCSLRTWNLVKGRQAYVINLNSKSKDARSLDKIIWSEDGVKFILSGGKYTEIWSIESGGILKVIEHNDKISSCIWLSENQIIVGYENGQIAIIEINECSKNIEQAHSGRVKALAKYGKWIVSASSTGQIKVWSKELKELLKYDTGCRITCLTIAASTVKIKEEEDENVLEVTEEVAEKKIKKRTVVVEVEDSDNEIRNIEENQKKRNDIIPKSKKNKTNSFEGIKNGNIKKKKRKSSSTEDIQHEPSKVDSPKQKKKHNVSVENSSDVVTTKRTQVLPTSGKVSKATGRDKKFKKKNKHKMEII